MAPTRHQATRAAVLPARGCPSANTVAVVLTMLRRRRPLGQLRRERPLLRLAAFVSSVFVLALAALASVPPRSSGWRGVDASPLLQAAPLKYVVLPALVILTVLAMRRWRIAVLVTGPGPIAIPDLRDATGEALPVELFSTLFRDRLTRVGLEPPNEVPGTTAPTRTIDLLRAATREKSPWAVLTGLMDVAWPRYGYVVIGTLGVRKRHPRCGVAVQIGGGPGTGGVLDVAWADDWDKAIELAAYAAAADILPRTRLSRRLPWVAWHGIAMKRSLVQHYVRAERLCSARRYDEGLWHFYEALQDDPRNFSLRIEIGQLQEQLGLWLDALETYWAVIDAYPVFAEQKPSRRIERAMRGPYYLAKYRFVILLGFGDVLARQWCTTPWTQSAGEDSGAHRTRRDREREEIRARLRQKIERAGWHEGFSATWPKGPDLPTLLDEPACRVAPADAVAPAHPDLAADDPQRWWLRRFFQSAACDETERLRAQGRAAVHASQCLTAPALEILVHWMQMQQELTSIQGRTALAGRPELEDWSVGSQTGGGEPVAIAERVAELAGRSSPTWLTNYNAACSLALHYAIARSEDRRPEDGARAEQAAREEQLARAAVRELERTVSFLDPQRLMAQRAWILSGDPDLAALRDSAAFKAFKCDYLPSSEHLPSRPADVHRLQLARHCARLLVETAVAIERDWHLRSHRRDHQASLPAHQVLDWLDEEREAWELVHDVAANHRHWQTRARLIRAMAARFRHEFPPAVHADYSAAPITGGALGDLEPALLEQRVRTVLATADGRLRRIEAAGPDYDGGLGRLHAHVRDHDDRTGSIPAEEVLELCLRRAAMWGRLRILMSIAPDDGGATRLDDAQACFERAFAEATAVGS